MMRLAHQLRVQVLAATAQDILNNRVGLRRPTPVTA